MHQSQQANQWLEHFNQLVLKNLSNPQLSNSFIATQLYMSDRKLYRVIQRLTGESPNHYIRRLRLEKARELLLLEDYILVKEVAQKVGFRKVHYFSALFKAKFGYSPVEILKRKFIA